MTDFMYVWGVYLLTVIMLVLIVVRFRKHSVESASTNALLERIAVALEKRNS